jgi:hypothetical protein
VYFSQPLRRREYRNSRRLLDFYRHPNVPSSQLSASNKKAQPEGYAGLPLASSYVLHVYVITSVKTGVRYRQNLREGEKGGAPALRCGGSMGQLQQSRIIPLLNQMSASIIRCCFRPTEFRHDLTVK